MLPQQWEVQQFPTAATKGSPRVSGGNEPTAGALSLTEDRTISAKLPKRSLADDAGTMCSTTSAPWQSVAGERCIAVEAADFQYSGLSFAHARLQLMVRF